MTLCLPDTVEPGPHQFVIVIDQDQPAQQNLLTAGELLASGIVGLWADRVDRWS